MTVITTTCETVILCATVTINCCKTHTHTTVLRPFLRDNTGEPMPEENFWTLWCKGRLTEADTQTICLGDTSSGLTSAHLHYPHIFYGLDALPATQPTASKHCWKTVQEITFEKTCNQVKTGHSRSLKMVLLDRPNHFLVCRNYVSILQHFQNKYVSCCKS